MTTLSGFVKLPHNFLFPFVVHVTCLYFKPTVGGMASLAYESILDAFCCDWVGSISCVAEK